MTKRTLFVSRWVGIFFCSIFLFASAPDVFAEAVGDADDDFFAAYERRATATQSKQPGWSVPLLAPHAGLIQSFRADFMHKSNPDGSFTRDYGAGKGFNFIPLPNTQIDINVPSFVDKSGAGNDGFGDAQFGVKYRLLTANEKQGNYSVMVGMAASFPTSSTNGQTHHVLTPNVAVGKGWGRWDVQSSATINLPVGNTAKIGRNVAWNTLVQCKVGKYFWPEVESNTVFYRGGSNDGKVASYVLPGVMSKFKLRPDAPGSRLTLASGVGWQVAVTPFRTYDHTPVVSVRLGF